jgi:hypothetical protein
MVFFVWINQIHSSINAIIFVYKEHILDRNGQFHVQTNGLSLIEAYIAATRDQLQWLPTKNHF